MQNKFIPKEIKMITIFSIVTFTLIVLINLVSIYHLNTLYTITEEIYDHPLKVSQASFKVHKEVLKMHRDMKDIVLITSQDELKNLIQRVDTEEQNVYDFLNIVKTNILGKEGKVLQRQTFELFEEWKAIRDEVIALVKEENFTQAISITKKKGAIHVKKLEESAKKLHVYANAKADIFITEARSTFENFISINIVLTFCVALIFIYFIFYIIKRIKNHMYHIAQNEEKYKELNERLELAIEGTNDGLWDWNVKEGSIYFSPRWKEMLGYEDSELENNFETWESRVHPDDLQETLQKIEICHSSPDVEYHHIHRLRHKDGSWVWILDRGQTLFDVEGYPIRMLGFHTDITKEKNLEQEVLDKDEIMIAQSRHAAMGEMISMIAHQWRQPISVIAMDANNILADVELDMVNKEDLRAISQDIINQTQELSKTINDFRDFFKPNKSTETVLLKSIFDDALRVIGKSLENNNITIFVNVDETIQIKTFSRELMQVIINIIKNAKEVLIEKTLKKKEIYINSFQKEEVVHIAIVDNAGGIDESIIDEIFDPYFTTKGQKNGTGLGLYISKTIIEKHLLGNISISNSQSGAMFEIQIPVDLNEGGG